MRQVAFYEAFDIYGVWYGTATLAAIKKARLEADRRVVMFGDEKLAGADGWACKARH